MTNLHTRVLRGVSAEGESNKTAGQQKTQKAEAEIVRTAHKAEIDGESMEEFLKGIVAYGLDVALTRIRSRRSLLHLESATAKKFARPAARGFVKG